MKFLINSTSWTQPLWAPDAPGSEAAAPAEGATEAAPAAEPQAEVKAEPAAEPAAEGKGEAQGETKEEPKVEEKAKPDWKDRRIAALTAKLREKEQAKPAVKPEGVKPEEQDLDALVESRVQQKVAIDAFNKACADAATAGRETFGAEEFDARLKQFQQVVDPTDQNQVIAYNTFLAAAIETGAAPKLIHALGGDLEEAERILSLPPVRMAVELTKLANKDVTEVSGAPKPIRPVASGSGVAHTSISPDDASRSDQLSTAEWMKRRNAQVEGVGRR